MLICDQFLPRSSTVSIDYHHENAPSSAGSQSDVLRCLNRVKDAYERLLQSDSIVVPLEIRWVAGSEIEGAIMVTYTHAANRLWSGLNGVVQNLQDDVQGIDSDPGEVSLIEALPSGSFIQYYYLKGNNTPVTSDVDVTSPLANRWFGTSNEPILILMNKDLLWDNQPEDENAIGYDITGVFTHEVGHAIGFASYLEALQSVFFLIL